MKKQDSGFIYVNEEWSSIKSISFHVLLTEHHVTVLHPFNLSYHV